MERLNIFSKLKILSLAILANCAVFLVDAQAMGSQALDSVDESQPEMLLTKPALILIAFAALAALTFIPKRVTKHV